MTEAQRVELYNSLCDFREELQGIYPRPTQKIHTLTQAITFIRGTTAKWERLPESQNILADNCCIAFAPSACSACHFALGRSDFHICPNCGAKMHH